MNFSLYANVAGFAPTFTNKLIKIGISVASYAWKPDFLKSDRSYYFPRIKQK